MTDAQIEASDQIGLMTQAINIAVKQCAASITEGGGKPDGAALIWALANHLAVSINGMPSRIERRLLRKRFDEMLDKLTRGK